MQSGESTPKKHKKHKKDKDRERERYDDLSESNSSSHVTQISTNARLKLILRVGGSSTPERGDSPGPHVVSVPYDEDSRQSSSVSALSLSQIKKAKKKEKKRKKEKKHKHRERKRKEKEAFLQMQAAAIAADIIPPPTPPSKFVIPSAENSNDSTSRGPTTKICIPKVKEPEPVVAPAVVPIPMEVDEPEPPPQPAEIPVNVLKETQPAVPVVPAAPKRPLDNKALQKLLEYLVRTLEKKDSQQFFAWPVTDKIAPGYSSIISNPMDFSKIRFKVDRAEYSTLAEFTADFKLMCDNAMVYNQPETIYYKSAKKLLQGGLKMLDSVKIRSLLPLIPSIRVLQEEQLGFQIAPDPVQTEGGDLLSLSEDESQENTCLDPTQSEHYIPPHPNDPKDLCGAFTDDLTTQEVLQQARLAARDAAHRLATKKPNKKMGFLRQRPDGSTSLAIIHPSSSEGSGIKEVPVSLGALTGKILHGSTILQAYKDDKKNFQRPAKPLNYGAFSSFAPTRDSSFSSLTDEESAMLLTAYGDESSKEYAQSLVEFTSGCDYTIRMVDEILNTLTHGEHSKAFNIIEERKRMEAEQAEFKRREEEFAKTVEDESLYLEKLGFPSITTANNGKTQLDNINFDSLASLNSLGIETGFLDELKQNFDPNLDKKLTETAQLLGTLQKAQNLRYSQPPLPVPPFAQPISELEQKLANRVTENLIDMAKETNPASISSVDGLRKAMGVDLHAFQYQIPGPDPEPLNSQSQESDAVPEQEKQESQEAIITESVVEMEPEGHEMAEEISENTLIIEEAVIKNEDPPMEMEVEIKEEQELQEQPEVQTDLNSVKEQMEDSSSQLVEMINNESDNAANIME